MQYGFIFDNNKCVGCHACIVACAIENQLEPGFNWRQVYSYNAQNITGINHFHLSLACNHCHDAECLKQCPANAISKIQQNGLVQIDGQKCIGCNFCSWVCPYDVPVFDAEQGFMTKCTFCEHRLSENKEPACVTICPVDALNIAEFEQNPPLPEIAGFPPSQMHPSIQIKQVQNIQKSEVEFVQPFAEELTAVYLQPKKSQGNKISLDKEWVLVLFSLVVASLGGLFSANVFGKVALNPFVFMAAGFFAAMLSLVHLGRKERAWRAVLNWKRSWLSREILFFSLFMSTASLFMFLKDIIFLGYAGLVLALASGFAVDMVYQVTAQKSPRVFHSAQIVLSMVFFAALFNQFTSAVILLGLMKSILYVGRSLKKMWSFLALLLFFLRTGIGFILPIILSALGFPYLLIALFIFAGELTDRIEFYMELEIITPAGHQAELLKRELQRKATK